jgi:hypothetical protein
MRSRRPVLLAVLACLLALVLAACGSSSSTSSSAAAAAGGGGAGGTGAQARLKFAKCMRAHGVNVPDPSANGGPPGGGGGGGGGGFRQLRPNFAPALKACGGSLRGAGGFGNVSPAQRAQFQKQLVKFAECMRSHNIDIPDPSTSGGGGFGIFRQIPQSERNSPAFQSATKACSSVLPRFGRRGGPGGGGPPATGSSA